MTEVSLILLNHLESLAILNAHSCGGNWVGHWAETTDLRPKDATLSALAGALAGHLEATTLELPKGTLTQQNFIEFPSLRLWIWFENGESADLVPLLTDDESRR